MVASKKIEELCKKIEARYTVRRHPEYADLTCPKTSDEVHFDRWFDLKEAYSSTLVESILHEMKVDGETPVVFDPFLGSGTTLVGARNIGFQGAGTEVNPFFRCIASAKMNRISIKDGKQAARSVMDAMTSNHDITIPGLSIIEKALGENLAPALRARQRIEEIDDATMRNFLLAGLGSVLERCSYTRKDGNGLKYPKNKQPKSVKVALQWQYVWMLNDMFMLDDGARNDYIIVEGDSRKDTPPVSDITHCIFSPPYANCFDYTEVYKLELWTLGFIKNANEARQLRERSLSSHLNGKRSVTVPPRKEIQEVLDCIDWNLIWGKSKIKHMLSAYFNDMKSVFTNIAGSMATSGTVACVVGNSAYGGVPVPTDLFLSMILEDCGFIVEEIRVARRLKTSSQQTKALKWNPYLRESIIIARKQ
jgi:hypothetical protein